MKTSRLVQHIRPITKTRDTRLPLAACLQIELELVYLLFVLQLYTAKYSRFTQTKQTNRQLPHHRYPWDTTLCLSSYGKSAVPARPAATMDNIKQQPVVNVAIRIRKCIIVYGHVRSLRSEDKHPPITPSNSNTQRMRTQLWVGAAQPSPGPPTQTTPRANKKHKKSHTDP